MNIEKLNLIINSNKFNKYTVSSEELLCNLHNNSYYNKTKEIYTLDGNGNINVGIYCKGVSKKILIVVGESWTYGDSLNPYVKCVDNLDNIPYRISTIFSGKVANFLNSDLLLFSQPGDSNMSYWLKLEMMLSFVEEQKYYDEIYLIVQMTSPGRDYGFHLTEEKLNHLFSKSKNDFPILSWNEWLYEYDKAYFNWLQQIVNKFTIKSTVLWKNFNEFNYKERDSYNFQVIEIPFQRYAIEMSGEKVDLPNCLEMFFYENMNKIYNLKVDLEIMEEELNKIDIGIQKLGSSMLNNWHPNESGHWILASLIREKIIK